MPHVVLAGMPGSGKGAVGRGIAARLGWQHIDTDARVEAQSGRSISEIFATDGEAAFRAMEASAVREALAETAPSIVSLGGGAVLCATTRELLSAHRVVWLRARLETLQTRVGAGAGRPLLNGDPGRQLAELADQRSEIYEQVASEIVDVDDLSVDAIVDLLT